MDADEASIPETPKPGISASSVLTPADRPEFAISGIRDDVGSPPTTSTTIECRAYKVESYWTNRIRFDLWKPSFLDRTGFRLEEGKMYSISGRIGDICTFQVRHRASKNPHLYVFVPQDKVTSFVPGVQYPITIEAAEESNVARVVMGRTGPVVAFYRTVLGSLGIDRIGEGLTEYVLVNRTQGGGPRRAFGNYSLKLGWVQLYVQSLGAEVDDMMELVSLRGYGIGDFVADFGSVRRGVLQNVELHLEGSGLNMQVDSLKIPLLNPELTSHGLKAVLRAKIRKEDREGVKFEFDGERMAPRLSNSSLVTRLQSSRYGLSVSYEREPGQSYVWRIPMPGVAVGQVPSQGYSWLKEAARVISRHEDGEGWYLLAMDPEIRDKIRVTLNAARSFRREKGNISENIVRYLLPSLGLNFVASHPWSGDGAESDALGHGPDILLREIKAAELDYMEVKWHRELEGVYVDACDQVRGYLADDWKYLDEEPVRGAYVAILDWNTRDLIARLFIQKIQAKS
jgi:hypothetical protein